MLATSLTQPHSVTPTISSLDLALREYKRTVIQNPWIPWAPHPRQQTFLMLGNVLEVMYGGAAAGGKSYALLAGAAQYVDVPGYNALIIRRTYKELNSAEALIPRSKEWWLNFRTPDGRRARWHETNHIWTFPSGATIAFGFLDHDNDIYQFQSAAWQYIAFDELTHFKEEHYTYLFSRLRVHVGRGLPVRMRSATNPGGRGHEWVKKRFISLRTPVPGRIFVPALLKDNPTVDYGKYVEAMANLGAIQRAQLLAGNWDAYEGGRFKRKWFKEFCTEKDRNGQWVYRFEEGRNAEGVPRFSEPGIHASKCHIIIICDPASRAEDVNDPTAIGVFAVTPDKRVLVLEVVRDRLALEKIVPTIAELCVDWAPVMYVGIEDVGFQLGILNEARKYVAPNGKRPIPAVRALSPEGKGKLVRATAAIIMAEAGRIFVPPSSSDHPWVDDYVSELVVFTGDEKEDDHDDQVDMTAYMAQEVGKGTGNGEVVFQEQDGKNESFHDEAWGGWQGGVPGGWQR